MALNDDVLIEGLEFENQKLEAISVACEFERLKNYFTARRNHSGEMIKFVNINAYMNFYKIVFPFFLKSHSVVPNIDYHRRLDINKYSE